jgi:hypothetical protein
VRGQVAEEGLDLARGLFEEDSEIVVPRQLDEPRIRDEARDVAIHAAGLRTVVAVEHQGRDADRGVDVTEVDLLEALPVRIGT